MLINSTYFLDAATSNGRSFNGRSFDGDTIKTFTDLDEAVAAFKAFDFWGWAAKQGDCVACLSLNEFTSDDEFIRTVCEIIADI